MNYKKYYDEANKNCLAISMNYLTSVHNDYISAEILVDEDEIKFYSLKKEMEIELMKINKKNARSHNYKRFVTEKDIDSLKESYKQCMTNIDFEYKELFRRLTGIQM